MADHTLKRGEKLTKILAALSDRLGSPLNVSDATITFHYRRAGAETWASGACTVVNGPLGTVMGPNVALTDVDNYQGYFKVTLPDNAGDPEYIPSHGYYEIEVEESAG